MFTDFKGINFSVKFVDRAGLVLTKFKYVMNYLLK